MRLIHDFTPAAGGASLFGVDEGHQRLNAKARVLARFRMYPVFWSDKR